MARGDFRLFLAGVVGPSGARLLGRFCHADPDLAAGVAAHLPAEEALRPDAVFAEVVHLPEGRLGNILARPTYRGYEIPYLGRSAAPAGRQLPLSDLRVSVDGGRVVLRSARLGREVVPRLTSAHNFAAGQGVYRFLCALQGQGVAGGLGWDWGPLAGSAFLPRVVSRPPGAGPGAVARDAGRGVTRCWPGARRTGSPPSSAGAGSGDCRGGCAWPSAITNCRSTWTIALMVEMLLGQLRADAGRHIDRTVPRPGPPLRRRPGRPLRSRDWWCRS